MSFVYFNSAAAPPLNLLSNLNHAPVQLTRNTLTPALLAVNEKLAEWLGADETWHFETIEHLWHALKATDRATFMQFTTGGRFGRFDAEAFELFFPGNGEAKYAYWSKKRNSGIIPKLASNGKKYGAKLGIGKSMRYARERNEDGVQRAVWKDLLSRKYIANRAHRDALLATGKQTLIEFARSSTSERPDYWGGCMRDGALVGTNFMGQMMEAVRESLQAE